MAVNGAFVFDRSLKANADLSSCQFYIVMSTAAGLASICTGSSGGASGPIGVLQNAPTSGHGADVRVLGESKLTAGGAISFGDQITSTTGGLGLTATTTGQVVIARACSASTASGQVISVVMTGPYFYTAGATA